MKFQVFLIAFNTIFFSLLINGVYEISPSLATARGQSGDPIDTCADLQKLANKRAKERGWNQIFHGFEDLPIRTNVYMSTPRGTDRLCQLGYLTSISPMGKKICRAHIYTNTESTKMRWSIGYFRTTFYDPVNYESEHCRWL
jgi:hypothetical protein